MSSNTRPDSDLRLASSKPRPGAPVGAKSSTGSVPTVRERRAQCVAVKPTSRRPHGKCNSHEPR